MKLYFGGAIALEEIHSISALDCAIKRVIPLGFGYWLCENFQGLVINGNISYHYPIYAALPKLCRIVNRGTDFEMLIHKGITYEPVFKDLYRRTG